MADPGSLGWIVIGNWCPEGTHQHPHPREQHFGNLKLRDLSESFFKVFSIYLFIIIIIIFLFGGGGGGAVALLVFPLITGEGGGVLQNGRGVVKFYPYEKGWGGKSLSHAEGGGGPTKSFWVFFMR